MMRNANASRRLGASIFALIAIAVLAACASLEENVPETVVTYEEIPGDAPLPVTVLQATLSSPAEARGIVDRFERTIRFYLPKGTALDRLQPTFTTKTAKLVSPTGPQNLATAVKYTFSDGAVYSVRAFDDVPDAHEVNAWIGTGINLGNDLDAWQANSPYDSEGTWTNGVVATREFFDDYRKMGFQSVRIPVTWGQDAANRFSDEGANSRIAPEFLKRVETVVGWGIDAGLTVVLNAHHEDWIRTKTGSNLRAQYDRFKALWTQLATHFRSWPPQLVFEILNEPQGPILNSEVNELNRTILPIVRKTNPTRVVVLGPNDWNSITALVDGVFTVPSPSVDPYVVATFHNYNPWSFAGDAKGRWGGAGDRASMDAKLTGAAAWAKAKGVPLYMGEYGVVLHHAGVETDKASRARWYEFVSRRARELGMSMAVWDDFGEFRLYEREDRLIDTTVVPNLVR